MYRHMADYPFKLYLLWLFLGVVLHDGSGGILFAKGCFELLLLVFEGDWMIYAYSPSRLVITGLKSVIAVIQFLLVIKKDLRYFSHIRGLARKEELSEEAAEKIEKGDY